MLVKLRLCSSFVIAVYTTDRGEEQHEDVFGSGNQPVIKQIQMHTVRLTSDGITSTCLPECKDCCLSGLNPFGACDGLISCGGLVYILR